MMKAHCRNIARRRLKRHDADIAMGGLPTTVLHLPAAQEVDCPAMISISLRAPQLCVAPSTQNTKAKMSTVLVVLSVFGELDRAGYWNR